MANLEETVNFDEGVYQIETDDVVIGGPEGIANKSAKNLANRTTWLKGEVDKLTTAADNKKQRMLGVPFWHLGETPPEHALQFSAIQLNRIQFKELWDSLNLPGRNIKWVTEADKVANKLFGCWSLGDGSTTFGVPDPRGDFLRIWDGDRGVDIARVLGSYQKGSIVGGNDDDDAANTSLQNMNLLRSEFGLEHADLSGLPNSTNIVNWVAGEGQNMNSFNLAPWLASVRPRNTAWMLCFYYE